MIEIKHTELPWEWCEHGVGEFVVCSEHSQDAVCVFDDPDGIYGFPDGYTTNGQAKANARLIVKAVNNYDRLREALRKITRPHGVTAFHFDQARALLQELDNLEQTK